MFKTSLLSIIILMSFLLEVDDVGIMSNLSYNDFMVALGIPRDYPTTGHSNSKTSLSPWSVSVSPSFHLLSGSSLFTMMTSSTVTLFWQAPASSIAVVIIIICMVIFLLLLRHFFIGIKNVGWMCSLQWMINGNWARVWNKDHHVDINPSSWGLRSDKKRTMLLLIVWRHLLLFLHWLSFLKGWCQWGIRCTFFVTAE